MKLDLKSFSFKGLLENKRFCIIFSVVLAFIVWLTIVVNETPTIERTITDVSITIDTTGTVAGKMGLDEVSGTTTKVSVKVSGPAYIVSNLSEEDLIVSPAMETVTAPGRYVIPLIVSKLNFSSEYSATCVPGQVELYFDYVDTKQMTVTPVVNGVSATPGLIAEEPVISNASESTITVKAPRTEMEKLNRIVAGVDAQEVLSSTKTYEAKLTLLDENGRELDASKYTLSTNNVKVSVPISKRKTVPVRAEFINAPSGYNEFLKYNLSVATVDIIGPADAVDKTTEVALEAIDFQNISKSNYSFDVPFVLSDAIRIADNITTVNVTVDTSDFSEQTVSVSNIVGVNNGNNYFVSLTAPLKNVKICGPKKSIRNLDASLLYAEVDLSGKAAGDYNITVTVKSSADGSIWQVGQYQASIRVK